MSNVFLISPLRYLSVSILYQHCFWLFWVLSILYFPYSEGNLHFLFCCTYQKLLIWRWKRRIYNTLKLTSSVPLLCLLCLSVLLHFSWTYQWKEKVAQTQIVTHRSVESELTLYRCHKSNFMFNLKFLMSNAFQMHYDSNPSVWMFKSGFMLSFPASGQGLNFLTIWWVPEYNLGRTV